MRRPQPDEYGAFYQGYINLVNDDVVSELRNQLTDVIAFLRKIPTEKGDHAYAEGKWTIKELLGHMIDTERIMAYRLLRIARNDATPLPGFEQDDYIANAHFNTQNFSSMIDELEALRKANLYLFESLTDEEMDRRGQASGYSTSARALLFILAGHLKHHVQVIVEKYL
jgi:uncharacterized damage-inducible protein DinB